MFGQPQASVLQPLDASISGFVGRTMRRSARNVHRQMGQGLHCLATIATVAPLVGIVGMLIGVPNAFPGVIGMPGIAHTLATLRLLADAYVPAALGLLVGVLSLWFYKYMSGRLENLDLEMESAVLDLPNLLIHCPVGCASTARVSFVNHAPIFRDEVGSELLDDHRPWYRSSQMVQVLLFVSWCVQFVRSFDDYEASLESVFLTSCMRVIFTFAICWFVVYPAWVKLLRRAPGGLATLTSMCCVAWSLAKLFFPERVW